MQGVYERSCIAGHRLSWWVRKQMDSCRQAAQQAKPSKPHHQVLGTS